VENSDAQPWPPGTGHLELAVIRGLLMDLAATGDSARTDQAFSDFLATVDDARDRGSVEPAARDAFHQSVALEADGGPAAVNG
jgi:hypothetical protein